MTTRKYFDATKLKGYQKDKKIYGHIYMIIFPNGRLYIGQCQHELNSKNERKYLGSGVYCVKALKFYGTKNVRKVILWLCYNIQEYNEREEFFIKLFKSHLPKRGYNILVGSANLQFGGVNPATLPEIKLKISQANKGRKLSLLTCRKMSIARKGKPQNVSEAERKRRSEKMKGNQLTKGRKHSKESIEKIKAKRKLQVFSEEARKKMSESAKHRKQ